MPYFYVNLKQKTLTYVGEEPPPQHQNLDIVIRNLPGWPRDAQEESAWFAKWINESANLSGIVIQRAKDIGLIKQIILDYRAMWLAHKAQTGARSTMTIPNLMRMNPGDKSEDVILTGSMASDLLMRVDPSEQSEFKRIMEVVPDHVIEAVGSRMKNMKHLRDLIKYAEQNNTVAEYIARNKKGTVLSSVATEAEVASHTLPEGALDAEPEGEERGDLEESQAATT